MSYPSVQRWFLFKISAVNFVNGSPVEPIISNIIMCAGMSSTVAGSDQRVLPGKSYLIKNPSNSHDERHRFRLVQRDQSKVNRTFGNRSAIINLFFC